MLARLAFSLLLLLLLLTPAAVAAADKDVEFFEKKIRPVLVQHCYECHSAAAKKLQGGLRLDSRPGIRRGGETGPAVVPGKPARSLLLAAIRHESLEMPPDRKLPPAVIADFETWIRRGARDPRDKPPTARQVAELSWQVVLADRRGWWSLQPVRSTPPPAVRTGDWSDQAIDRFVLARLEQAGLAPVPDAAPRTLCRRLTLVLTGLPSTPAEVSRFLAAWAVDPEAAWQELVDRTLASPHFGERWARHWMDVVRFTETHGNEWNYEVHHAWRYRDYLVRAFNQDLPYDQLIREHIAGDLLETPRWNREERVNESVIGTAFYRFGEVNHDDCIALRSIGYDILANQLDTLTKTFLASTVACARCHDHKIDAFSMKDYYALLGVLRSTRLVARTIDAPEVNAVPLEKLKRLKPGIRKRLAHVWRQQAPKLGKLLLAGEAVRSGGEAKRGPDLEAGDAGLVGRWKTALSAKNPPLEHPLHAFLAVVNRDRKTSVQQAWSALADRYLGEHRERTRFNLDNFQTLYDLRNGHDGWTRSGHALRDAVSGEGELVLAGGGEAVVVGLLPAGIHSHRLTARLGGGLRSPILHTSARHLSLQVLGGERAAVRIVSNNCQLNYVNYKVLLSDKPGWITFEPAADNHKLRAYIELITKFDNPKFPDQLATIGGAPMNDRVPWSKIAADPRSFFGISRVVLHDVDESPRPELDHLCRLFEGGVAPASLEDVAGRYGRVLSRAVLAWSNHNASPAQVRLVDWLVRNGLLANSVSDDQQLGKLVAEYRRIETRELQRPRVIPGVEDVDDGLDQPLLVHGNSTELGEAVPRRFLEVVDGNKRLFRGGSGRKQLAERISSADNPLTARVMANRVWHHLFGTGLVRTVDDFGRLGEKPSHPELLDHLATSLVRHGWSTKQLIRRIVLSRTFRLSARVEAAARTRDPLDRLLHHYPARRLDAESIRDAVLATSGRLDRRRGGRSIYPYRKTSNADRRLFAGPLDGDGRRSLYIKTNLMEPPRFLSAFNTPGGKVSEGRRDVSNVPAQALAMLNDPFIGQQSKVWSRRLLERPHRDAAERIEEMFRRALGRGASAEEQRRFGALVETLRELHQVAGDQLMRSPVIWKDLAHVMFNLREFVYLP